MRRASRAIAGYSLPHIRGITGNEGGPTMTPIELIAQHLAGTGEWVKMTIADMTDAELMQRPAPAANHGAWNFGHALYSEHEMLSGIGAKLPELPPRFGEIYGNKNCKSDNAAEFLKKDQMIPLFDKVH